MKKENIIEKRMVAIKGITAMTSILRGTLTSVWSDIEAKRKHERYTIANREEHKNESWINIMKPGLKELCDQFILASKSDTFHKCNFILCIDSLVPKLAGAIRDLIRLLEKILLLKKTM